MRDGVQQDFLTARLNPDGSLIIFRWYGRDQYTGRAGNDAGEGLMIQQDGKIVVAGSATEDQRFKFAVVRFDADGSLDTSFSGDGKVISPTEDGSSIALDVLVLPDGGIVAAGDADSRTLRFGNRSTQIQSRWPSRSAFWRWRHCTCRHLLVLIAKGSSWIR